MRRCACRPSWAGTIRIHRDQGEAALELLSRFAVDPRWLIYLPPTMAACEAATADGLLEHPAEAFGHFRARGVRTVVCEESTWVRARSSSWHATARQRASGAIEIGETRVVEEQVGAQPGAEAAPDA